MIKRGWECTIVIKNLIHFSFATLKVSSSLVTPDIMSNVSSFMPSTVTSYVTFIVTSDVTTDVTFFVTSDVTFIATSTEFVLYNSDQRTLDKEF